MDCGKLLKCKLFISLFSRQARNVWNTDDLRDYLTLFRRGVDEIAAIGASPNSTMSPDHNSLVVDKVFGTASILSGWLIFLVEC